MDAITLDDHPEFWMGGTTVNHTRLENRSERMSAVRPPRIECVAVIGKKVRSVGVVVSLCVVCSVVVCVVCSV